MSHPTWAPSAFKKITPGAGDLPKVDGSWPRGLQADVAGTVDGTDGSGQLCAGFPISAGLNPGHWQKITASTVTNLWAAYN